MRWSVERWKMLGNLGEAQQNAYDAKPLFDDLPEYRKRECTYRAIRNDGTVCAQTYEPFLPDGFEKLPTDIRPDAFDTAEIEGERWKERLLRAIFPELSGRPVPWLWGPTGDGLEDISLIVDAGLSF